MLSLEILTAQELLVDLCCLPSFGTFIASPLSSPFPTNSSSIHTDMIKNTWFYNPWQIFRQKWRTSNSERIWNKKTCIKQNRKSQPLNQNSNTWDNISRTINIIHFTELLPLDKNSTTAKAYTKKTLLCYSELSSTLQRVVWQSF